MRVELLLQLLILLVMLALEIVRFLSNRDKKSKKRNPKTNSAELTIKVKFKRK